MPNPYFNARLMPGYPAIVQIKRRLSLGDGLEGLHSCPNWF
jgi:hypothetical protein